MTVTLNWLKSNGLVLEGEVNIIVLEAQDNERVLMRLEDFLSVYEGKPLDHGVLTQGLEKTCSQKVFWDNLARKGMIGEVSQ